MSKQQQLVKREEAAPVQQSGGGQDIYKAVLAAVNDPNKMDPDRLEKFLQLAREMEADQAKREYNAAFARVKVKLPTIDKRGLIPDNQGRVRSRFAIHDDLHEAITPILEEEGMGTSFSFKDAGEGRMTCTMTLLHRGGHSQDYGATGPWSMDLPKATLNQKSRAAQSYMKRNMMIDVFDILAKEQDDDGSGQGVAEPITDEQAQAIEETLSQIHEFDPGNRKRFFKWLALVFKTDNIRELRQGAQFEAVMEPLRKKLAEKK